MKKFEWNDTIRISLRERERERVEREKFLVYVNGEERKEDPWSIKGSQCKELSTQTLRTHKNWEYKIKCRQRYEFFISILF